MKQEFKSIEELLAAVQLHENIMAFRLYEGQILSSINAGMNNIACGREGEIIMKISTTEKDLVMDKMFLF